MRASRPWLNETDEIDRAISPGYFNVGTTSDALKSIGVRDGNVYWRKYKVGSILQEHPEIGTETIKAVPEILEQPTVVLKSLTQENSIVLFGDLRGRNGERVMAALHLTPKKSGGMEAEFSLIASAYGRTEKNVQNLLRKSEILYLDKERADTWLKSLRVQFPSHQPTFGSIGSITYEAESVKMKGKTLADYFEVAKMFGVDNIDFYAAMAKAWLCDEDAAEDKTRQYWEHVATR